MGSSWVVVATAIEDVRRVQYCCWFALSKLFQVTNDTEIVNKKRMISKVT